MDRLLILSCSRRKHIKSDFLPAIQRYDGPAFRIIRRFLQQQLSQPPEIYILSAKFGLIGSNQSIPYYDQRMTPQRAKELQPSVLSNLRTILSERSYQKICICMGKNYMQALDGYERLLHSELSLRIIAGPLGKQSSGLYDWLYEKPPTQRQLLPSNIHRGKAKLRGVEVTLTPEQILALARQAVRDQLREATNYQSWYVPVDEYRIAPKWLVSQITGLPVKAFVTDEARRVLSELGIEVSRV